MFRNFLIPKEHIKYETENAYLLTCPTRNGYDRYQYWISKKQAQMKRIGTLNYLEVTLLMDQTINLSRFIAKRQPQQLKTISGNTIAELHHLDQHLMQIKIQYQYQNMQADFIFEQQQRTPVESYWH